MQQSPDLASQTHSQRFDNNISAYNQNKCNISVYRPSFAAGSCTDFRLNSRGPQWFRCTLSNTLLSTYLIISNSQVARSLVARRQSEIIGEPIEKIRVFFLAILWLFSENY